MKQNKALITALALVSACTVPVCASAATIDLTGMGWVTYGDANSYALNVPSPGHPTGTEIMSGPGQIDLFVKLGLNPPGQLSNGTPNMDDAFRTPTANPISGFRMGSANEPGGAASQGSWDRVGWWDATLTSLNSELDLTTNSLVFFFANNETGSAPDLAAWARVEMTDKNNNVIGRWDLTNDPTHQGLVGYGPPPVGGGTFLGNPTAYTSNNAEPFVSDFVDSGNDICTDASDNLVPCGSPTVAHTYHENLGGDRAAYAEVLPEMDALIAGLVAGGANLDDYAMHVNYRLGVGPELTQAGGAFPTTDNYALNGGDEKVFIGTQLSFYIPPPPPTIPEPSTFALAGLGMLGIAAWRRRKNK